MGKRGSVTAPTPCRRGERDGCGSGDGGRGEGGGGRKGGTAAVAWGCGGEDGGSGGEGEGQEAGAPGGRGTDRIYAAGPDRRCGGGGWRGGRDKNNGAKIGSGLVCVTIKYITWACERRASGQHSAGRDRLMKLNQGEHWITTGKRHDQDLGGSALRGPRLRLTHSRCSKRPPSNAHVYQRRSTALRREGGCMTTSRGCLAVGHWP